LSKRLVPCKSSVEAKNVRLDSTPTHIHYQKKRDSHGRKGTPTDSSGVPQHHESTPIEKQKHSHALPQQRDSTTKRKAKALPEKQTHTHELPQRTVKELFGGATATRQHSQEESKSTPGKANAHPRTAAANGERIVWGCVDRQAFCRCPQNPLGGQSSGEGCSGEQKLDLLSKAVKLGQSQKRYQSICEERCNSIRPPLSRTEISQQMLQY
jgi:hypothetical protein